jgi:hypothetical protein
MATLARVFTEAARRHKILRLYGPPDPALAERFVGRNVTVDRRPLPDDDTEPCVAVVKDGRFLGALDADLVEQALSAIVA